MPKMQCAKLWMEELTEFFSLQINSYGSRCQQNNHSYPIKELAEHL